MRHIHPLPPVLLGLAAFVIAETASILAVPVPAEDAPVLVVAPPWHGGAEAVVLAAGGELVSPVNAPMSAVAAGASHAALKQSGAWFLLDPNTFEFLCASGYPS
ncbi:MAG: hypothetical protein VX378_06485 [Pseudomonadota bacterium]|nr:hypothetical protein [Pseudomonadota bacterium]MEE3070732.1 hypothetical protein [Pseudomonadota bacterium]